MKNKRNCSVRILFQLLTFFLLLNEVYYIKSKWLPETIKNEITFSYIKLEWTIECAGNVFELFECTITHTFFGNR